ncbi:hypothetical protein PIB30_088472, partial [Stylosanthes scabra]|nr:hypothetical protein [Stylosanthes scabra]
MNKANVYKGPEVFMGRFFLGLNQDIADEVEVYDYATLEYLLSLAIEAEMQQQRLATRLEDTSYGLASHEQFSNAAFTSSKVDLEELVEDVVSGDVVLEEPKMHTVSQGILGCEESDNQEEQKKQLRKEESETISDCFSECEQKIFEKQNENREEDLKCASMLLFENFTSIMVSVEGPNVDKQDKT